MALHIRALNEDKLAYLSYFWWLEHYTNVHRPDQRCILCNALNDGSLPRHRVIHDFNAWWNPGTCREPDWGVPRTPVAQWKNGGLFR